MSEAKSGHAPLITVDLPGFQKHVRQGAVLTIEWRAVDAPNGAGASLWIRKTATGYLLGPIASELPMQGRYDWHIPVFRSSPIPCARDRTGGCVGSMNPGTRYTIVARLYIAADTGPIGVRAGNVPQRLIASSNTPEFLMLREK